jgi:hypothetical protein
LPLRYSLDCSFLIAPSVFSGLFIFDCPLGILWIVHFWLPLRYSLGCSFFIAPLVFSNIYLYTTIDIFDLKWTYHRISFVKSYL